MKVLFPVLVLLVAGLAGCADEKPPEVIDDVPDEITERDLRELEDIVASQFPRRIGFPGQQALEPVQVVFDEVLGAGTGFLAPELPDDEGPIDAGTTYIPYDLSEQVAPGQAVELRIKLKWYGDPGASADFDIYVDVPGERDAFQKDRFDESWNWNIITKFRVVNTVRVEGAPFEVGVQVANGKNVHPEGIRYVLTVDVVYGKDVLPPSVPYIITVPEGASNIILESEPLTGDEHVDSELVIIDPNDRIHRYIKHNDIATETIPIAVSIPGEYVIYSHYQHGGFMRLELDVPNPDFMARPITMTETRTSIYSSPAPPVPGTYTEQCPRLVSAVDCDAIPASNSQGGGGGFTVEGNPPLDLYGWIDTAGGGSIDAAINLTSSIGWVSTAVAFVNVEQDDNRLGAHKLNIRDRSRIVPGEYQYFLVVNAGMVDIGYTVLSYER